MNEEKKKILDMIAEGKISSAEGLELLQALEENELKTKSLPGKLRNRFLRIRVDAANSTKKVNVRIPLVLLKVASKFAGMSMNFIPEEAKNEIARKGIDLAKIDVEELLRMIEQGVMEETLVDIDVVDPVEGPVRVEIYVE